MAWHLEIWYGALANNRSLLLEPDGDLFIGGSLSQGSDRNTKEQITHVSYNNVLQAINEMPIYEWQYKDQDRRHIGLMAQDFHAAFGLGDDDTTIASIDADGVALAAIKAQQEIISNQQVQIDGQQSEIDYLKQVMAEIRVILPAFISANSEVIPHK